jgi:hypothetical protein
MKTKGRFYKIHLTLGILNKILLINVATSCEPKIDALILDKLIQMHINPTYLAKIKYHSKINQLS